jgi:signal transduction histidine kinase
MVAHDLKNPASTIKNFVELLESYDLSAQEQHDVFSGLIETSLRLVKLADEFTNVIAEEFVPFNLHKSKRDLKKIVESMVKVNKVIAQKKNIEIRLFNTDSELQIEMDEEKIKEVLDNFIGNAIKFCPEKSKIDVITKFENNKAIVEVQDNGFGLNEDEIDRAFEKGSKLSNKPTGNETSSGLGLWISKRIIEEHKGRVFLKSKKGFGSTFTFSLPIN